MNRFPLWLVFSLLVHGVLLALIATPWESASGESGRSIRLVLQSAGQSAAPIDEPPAAITSPLPAVLPLNRPPSAVASSEAAQTSRAVIKPAAVVSTITPRAVLLQQQPPLVASVDGGQVVNSKQATKPAKQPVTVESVTPLAHTPPDLNGPQSSAPSAYTETVFSNAEAVSEDASPRASAQPATDAALAEREASAREAKQGIGRLLLESLREHFSYPLRARRQGWQGDVLLEVSLASSGDITAIRVVNGSGYSSLDRAAVKSMAAVERIPMTLALAGNYEIPVRYRLIN